LCLVELRGFEPLTPCMPCSFGVLSHPRSESCTLPSARLELTVTVRWLPLVTAAYGTRVARLARTTMLAPGADSSSGSNGEARPRWPPIRGQEPERTRGSRVGDSSSTAPASYVRARSPLGEPPAAPMNRSVTAPARCCRRSSTRRLPTQHGPAGRVSQPASIRCQP
jgi:hypothetical protein